MKYLTFLDEKCLDELLHNNCSLVGDNYNRTVNDYVFGVIPRVDDVVAQTVLILTYMAHPDKTACVRIQLDEELPVYDAIGVNNANDFFFCAPRDVSLAVIPSIECDMVERSYAPKDIVTFHELLEFHLPEILKLLMHEDYSKVQVDWDTVKKAWTVMEKTHTMKEKEFKQIKSAVREV